MTTQKAQKCIADFYQTDEQDIFNKAHQFGDFLREWKASGTYSYHRMLGDKCTNRCRIYDPATRQYRDMLVLASNNYLGLNLRTETTAAAQAALEKYGTGMSGSRFLSGTYELLVELEQEIAKFEQTEEAVVFTSGYQANVGTISALLRKDDVAVIDRLAHASIVDGCRLSGCTLRSFRHNDAGSLEKVLQKCVPKHKGILIIVDGVFSMDGDIAPLHEIVPVAKKYGARILVDEAHSTGVLGKNGSGTVEHFGLKDQVDILIGTFSKALAATGGFAATSHNVAQYIRQYGRSYTFSASPAPAVMASVLAGLKIIQNEPGLRQKLWDNIHYFHDGLVQRGFSVYPSPPQSAIMTVEIGPDALVHAMSRDLYDAGLFTSAVVHPAVPPNRGTLRLSLSALHSREDLDFALKMLSVIGQKYNLAN